MRIFGELFRAFPARDPDRFFWQVELFSNLRLFLIVLISILVQLGIHHNRAIQELFSIGPLSFLDCVLTLAVRLVRFILLECSKLARRVVSSSSPR